MTAKTLSCSFADCRSPGYARWLRVAYFLNTDEPVNTTFLACREHDRRLMPVGDLPSLAVLRIGLYEDEKCWHNWPPLQVETRYGVRLFFDGQEDRYEDSLDMSQEAALNALRRCRERMATQASWRVTRAVLLTQRVDVHPWLEQVEEEEEARGR